MQDEKKKYLKQAIEKLERALELNADSRTHEGELAVFSLGNALYFEFFLEKDDTKAATSLSAAKKKFEESIKKEPNNSSFRQMIDQLDTAHEQVGESSNTQGRGETNASACKWCALSGVASVVWVSSIGS